jgi:hypothetical protein
MKFEFVAELDCIQKGISRSVHETQALCFPANKKSILTVKSFEHAKSAL